jgi:hypothetical protein
MLSLALRGLDLYFCEFWHQENAVILSAECQPTLSLLVFSVLNYPQPGES